MLNVFSRIGGNLDMITFERVKSLAGLQKKSLNQVEEDLGYGKNVLYRLKNTSPSAERLQELANYFHTSTDYLLGRTDDPNLYDENGFRIPTAEEDFGIIKNEEEEDLIAAFRLESEDMTEEDKKKFNKSLKGMMKVARGLLNDDSNWKE